jgi:hypothetical protein
MDRQSGADAGDHAVAAADQRWADRGCGHASIQTRIRVPGSRCEGEPGVSQGQLRVFPNRGLTSINGSIEV